MTSSLEEANRRLQALQAARRQQRIEQGLPHDVTLIDQGQHDRTAVPAIVESLPAHLGWESDAVTRALRQAQQRRQIAPNFLPPHKQLNPPVNPAKSAHSDPNAPAQVVLYPDLAAAILRQNLDAPGRVYFLLRAYDAGQNGRGWLPLSDTRSLLTGKESPLKIVSRRQLHNLLAAGEGVFWTQNNGAVWLKSPAKVAAALGVHALRGRAVSVDPSRLTGHVADARAQLYAAYLSGRPHNDMPIARETLTAVTGVDERTQKAYEQRAGITTTSNFCIGERLASDDAQAQAWAHRGQGAFKLTDKKGKQGTPGQSYLAWQMPNSYQTKQQKPCPRGKQRRVNRELKVLLIKTAAGNSSSPENHQRRYYPSGGDAARAYGRSRDPVCWRRGGQGVKVWHELR